MYRSRVLPLALLLLGCGSDVTLAVDVYTDFLPGTEVASIRVAIVDGPSTVYDVSGREAFTDGTRVADFEGLAPIAARTLTVSLLAADGSVLLERPVIADNRASLVVSVVLSRRCLDVMCAPEFACLGMACVDQSCTSGLEPSCPMPECETDADCTPMASCASARCSEATCVYVPDDAQCTVGSCDVTTGCAIDAPQPIAPHNGAATGSPNAPAGPGDPLAPVLRWREVAGADRYRVQMTRECRPGQILGCAFDSPDVEEESGDATFLPSRLAVSMTPPVGALYAWRVQACVGPDCGDWSETRYLRVGMSRGDFDGDGYADLAVGTRPEASFGPAGERVYIYRNGPAGLSMTPAVLDQGSLEDRFSETLATGDFNGDGFWDLAVGAPGADRVYVYRGSPSGLNAAPGVVLTGPSDLGRWLGASDTNVDGTDELWVASSTDVRLHRGRPGEEPEETPMDVLEEAAGARRIALLGDVDGGGEEDLLIATDGGYQIYGGGPSFASRPLLASAMTSDPYYGRAVGAAGDVDDDGLAELLVGSGGAFNIGGGPPVMGGVYLESIDEDRTAVRTDLSPPAGFPPERFGWTLRALGDLDGDGRDDFAVGLVDGTGWDGAVFLYLDDGPPTVLADPEPGATGVFAEDLTVIDVGGDGDPDLVVGAIEQGADGTVLVYESSGGTFGPPTAFPHPPPGGALGWFGASLAPRHR